MRPLVYGNGNLLICANELGIIRDVYYPHVGSENHGVHIKIGIYDVDLKKYSWCDTWTISQKYQTMKNDRVDTDGTKDNDNIDSRTTSIGVTTYENHNLALKVKTYDIVHPIKNVFYRVVKLINTSNRKRNIRLFSAQFYRIYESGYSQTAYVDSGNVIHYKSSRYFLHGTYPELDQYSVGIADWNGAEGTWRDAEDGELQMYKVANGSVDSTIRIPIRNIEPKGEVHSAFWLCIGRSLDEVKKLDRWVNEWIAAHVDHETDDMDALMYLTRTSQNFWLSWLDLASAHHQNMKEIDACPPAISHQFMRSLLTIASHIDSNGSIIASCDSNIRHNNADTYSYCWPRDAAWIALALSSAGYHEIVHNCSNFLANVISPEGYLLHKYTPNGEFGSTWHEVPMIQIDETASPIYAIYRDWLESKNIVMVAKLFPTLIQPATDYLVTFIDRETGLPRPSYDLWEERRGIYTYSASTIYGAFVGASKMAEAVGHIVDAKVWAEYAEMVKKGILTHLYDNKLKRFVRGIDDDTIDSSLFAVWYHGVLPADDERVINTMVAIEHELGQEGGGIARYEGDQYMGHMNAWIICTLWLAQWYSEIGNPDKAISILKWVVDKAHPTGLLPEQVGKHGESISVLPLIWSHSTFVLTVFECMKKKKEMELINE